MAYMCQLGRASTRRAAASAGEAMRMGALLHNGFVGWLLLAVGATDTTRRARAQAAVGAGARELTSVAALDVLKGDVLASGLLDLCRTLAILSA